MNKVDSPLVLAEFLPYRLSMLANRVSRDLSRLYAEQFKLTIIEWRIVAILGQHPGVSADEVCQRSEMDKVAVSRAVARLRYRNLITRKVNKVDRRKSMLKLSVGGQKIYQRIVPLARAYEEKLLAGLSVQARQDLSAGLQALDTATTKDH